MIGYLQAIADLIRNPTSNLTAAAFGLAIVVLLGLIILLLVLALYVPGGRKGILSPESRVAGEPVSRRPRGIRIPLWLAVIVTVLSITAAYGTTSVSSFCTDVCHEMSSAADSWEQSAHADVACVRCHEGRLVLSAPSGAVLRTYSGIARLVDVGADRVSEMPMSRCLGCHKAIRTGTFVSEEGVRMVHEHVIEAGAPCTVCHNGVAHVREDRFERSVMTECLRCHDDESASAACETCHEGDPGRLPITERIFGLAEMPPVDCEGCHTLDACDDCHGLRMPHPDDFASPYSHARLGAFEGRQRLCFRCHVSNDCQAGCHGDLNGHGPGWKRLHATLPEAYCSGCHDTDRFCGVCH